MLRVPEACDSSQPLPREPRLALMVTKSITNAAMTTTQQNGLRRQCRKPRCPSASHMSRGYLSVKAWISSDNLLPTDVTHRYDTDNKIS
ncbi:hypothetical protein BHE74_00039688 [Ensete ventricosum]|nr:hypothetical protein BHE74_00039688 [Ensete ventricosum]RZS22356.1 hypothetical protein BHM03_00055119 [Ensete ventricosum]